MLAVQEGVLIPRPETEQLIDIAQNVMLRDETLAKGVWADLGTGSGALAIGLSQLLEAQGRVVAVDLSHVAVSVARHNAERYGVQVCFGFPFVFPFSFLNCFSDRCLYTF